MNKIINILCWVFGIFFAFGFLTYIKNSPVTAISSLLISILLIPINSKYIDSKLHKPIDVKIKSIIIFILFIVMGSSAPKTKTNTETNKIATPTLTPTTFIETTPITTSTKIATTETSQEIKSNPTIKVSPTAVPTKDPQADSKILEENLVNTIKDFKNSDMTFKKVEVQKSDSNRPKDTKMITVSVDVKTFWDRKSLLRSTSNLTSALFKTIYDFQDIKAYDVIVWYYGETEDRYGNKSSNIIISYGVDKTTFNKINWGNFDKPTLCDFLKQEDLITQSGDTACNILVNIK